MPSSRFGSLEKNYYGVVHRHAVECLCPKYEVDLWGLWFSYDGYVHTLPMGSCVPPSTEILNFFFMWGSISFISETLPPKSFSEMSDFLG